MITKNNHMHTDTYTHMVTPKSVPGLVFASCPGRMTIANRHFCIVLDDCKKQ